jgi:hypothetical protein
MSGTTDDSKLTSIPATPEEFLTYNRHALPEAFDRTWSAVAYGDHVVLSVSATGVDALNIELYPRSQISTLIAVSETELDNHETAVVVRIPVFPPAVPRPIGAIVLLALSVFPPGTSTIGVQTPRFARVYLSAENHW